MAHEEELLPLGDDSEIDEIDALIGRIEGSRIEGRAEESEEEYF